MKITKTIASVLMVIVLVSFAYWLGYQHGTTPKRARIATASSMRQVELRFRDEHNGISRFIATGSVTTPKPQTQE